MGYKTSVFNDKDAARQADWIKNRGGVAVWLIQLIGGGPNNTKSYSTPALKADGSPMGKPHWSVGSKPDEIITDPGEISVVTPREVRRLRVAIRMGSQGFMLKCSEVSSRKIRDAVMRAGEGAWHEFDYSSQEAVIYVAGQEVSLADWMRKGSAVNQEASSENGK